MPTTIEASVVTTLVATLAESSQPVIETNLLAASALVDNTGAQGATVLLLPVVIKAPTLGGARSPARRAKGVQALRS
jgi:hypothetical protein